MSCQEIRDLFLNSQKLEGAKTTTVDWLIQPLAAGAPVCMEGVRSSLALIYSYLPFLYFVSSEITANPRESSIIFMLPGLQKGKPEFSLSPNQLSLNCHFSLGGGDGRGVCPSPAPSCELSTFYCGVLTKLVFYFAVWRSSVFSSHKVDVDRGGVFF